METLAQRILGKKLLAVLGALAIATASAGCNFFGKLEDEQVPTEIGKLASGASFLGSWTTNAADTSPDGHPSYAVTETYTFDPTGSVRVELRDVLGSGITCTGFGQYRQNNGSDVTIYLQAAEPPTCAFAAQIRLTQLSVSGQVLSFKDPLSGYTFKLLKTRDVPIAAPIGVWDFDGAGADINGDNGIDYLFLDPKGYFLIQTTYEGEQYLLIGYYKITGNSLALYFFSNGDPAQLAGDPLVYKQFITDGVTLELIEETPAGDVLSSGTRL